MDKILFNLEVDNDYPPVSVERIWAEKLSSGEYQIRNIPFYTKEVSFEDKVFVAQGTQGQLVFESIAEGSGNSTVRIVFFDSGKSERDKLLDSIKNMGCSWEGMSEYFFSINIPREIFFDDVILLLASASRKKWLDYEYGMVRH